ncbi:MAG: hypothetical protein AB1767_03035 [Bacillota bacterium]
MVDFDRLTEILDRALADEVRREVADRRQEIAGELGLDPAEVSTQLLGLASSFARKGVIVNLHIGRSRFEQNLTPEDIGLVLGQESEALSEGFREYLKTLYLGRRTLVTPRHRRLLRQLDNMEGRARGALSRRSFPVRLGFGRDILRFVPLHAYRDLRDELLVLEADYASLIEQLVAELEQIKIRTRSMLSEAALEVYRILQRNAGIAVTSSEFRAKFVETAMKAFPSRHDIEGAASFKVRTMLLPFDAAGANPSFDRDMRVLDDIKESLIEEKNAFVQNVVGHLNKVVHDVVVSASACLRKHGTLLGPNVHALKEAFEAFDSLNHVVGDRALAEKFGVLQAMVLEGRSRDMGSVAAALNELRERTGEVLTTLGQAPRAKRGAAGDDDFAPLDLTVLQGRGKRMLAGEEKIETVLAVRRRRGAAVAEGQQLLPL